MGNGALASGRSRAKPGAVPQPAGRASSGGGGGGALSVRGGAQDAGVLGDEVRVRCQKCLSVQTVPFGTSAFLCSNCGVRVQVAVGEVARQAGQKVGPHAHFAEDALREVSEEQAAVVQSLWEQVDDEFGLQEALWDSVEQPSEDAPHARALVRAAFAARDGAQATDALAHAEQAGLPAASEGLRAALARVRQEEDLELLWRCLGRAVAEQDRVDLEFWLQEAESQGLCMPEEVRAALRSMRHAEHARLAELEYQATLDTRAADAHRLGDKKALDKLASEARLIGADPSAAEAGLTALRAVTQDPGEAKPPEAGAAASPSAEEKAARGGIPSERAASKGRPVFRPATQFPAVGSAGAADELRRLDVASLKAALQAFGVEVTTASVVEKEDLVQLLMDARAGKLPRKPAPPPQASPRPSPRPQPQPQPKPKMPPFRPPPAGSFPAGGFPASGFPAGGFRPGGFAPGGSDTGPPPAGPLTRPRALFCLGLAVPFSGDQLRRAYKQAALRWHPDRRQNHDCADLAKVRFQEVRAAFELLQAELPPQP